MRAVVNFIQNQSDLSGQPQRAQTIQWTSQDSK